MQLDRRGICGQSLLNRILYAITQGYANSHIYIYVCVHSVKVYIGGVTAALANSQIKLSIEQKPIHAV